MSQTARYRDTIGSPLLPGALFIFLLVLTAFSPAFRAGFIWDDDTMVWRNSLVTESGSFWKIWFSSKQYDYYPVTFSLLWAEWRAFGTQPMGYHVVNVVLHALGSILLWRVLLRLKIPGAVWVAAVFAVHPVCVASVAWIAEQKNTLSFVFFSLSALFFLRSEDEPAKAENFYWLSLFAFVLALLSKASVVMLPAVFILLAWWRRGLVTRKDWTRTIPFFAAAAVATLVTVWFQTYRAIHGTGPTESTLTRLLGGTWGLWFHLYKALLPVKLSAIYPRWEINSHSLFTYIPAFLWMGLLAACWWQRKGWGRAPFFALTFFTFALLPVLGFFNMAFLMHSRVADQWMYLAIIGTTSFVISTVTSRWKLTWLPLLLIALFSAATFQRSRIYHDQETLWTETLKANPKSWGAHLNYGSIVGQRGQLDVAETHLQTALSLYPYSSEAMQNMGNVFRERGDFTNAITWYEKALNIKTNDVALKALLSQSHATLAQRASVEGRLDEALEQYNAARVYDEDSPILLHQYALVLDAKGRHRDAWVFYRAAINNKPDFAEAHYNFALNLEDLNDEKNAVEEYRIAEKCGFKTEFLDFNFASALFKVGSFDEAAVRCQKVLEAKPNYDEAHYLYARVLERQGKAKDSIGHYRKTIELSGNDARPMRDLAWILATAKDGALRDPDEATKLAMKAVQLTSSKDAKALDSLAAAYAQLGRFGEAVEVGKMAFTAAQNSQQTDLAPEIEKRIALYRTKTPFQQP